VLTCGNAWAEVLGVIKRSAIAVTPTRHDRPTKTDTDQIRASGTGSVAERGAGHGVGAQEQGR